MNDYYKDNKENLMRDEEESEEEWSFTPLISPGPSGGRNREDDFEVNTTQEDNDNIDRQLFPQQVDKTEYSAHHNPNKVAMKRREREGKILPEEPPKKRRKIPSVTVHLLQGLNFVLPWIANPKNGKYYCRCCPNVYEVEGYFLWCINLTQIEDWKSLKDNFPALRPGFPSGKAKYLVCANCVKNLLVVNGVPHFKSQLEEKNRIINKLQKKIAILCRDNEQLNNELANFRDIGSLLGNHIPKKNEKQRNQLITDMATVLEEGVREDKKNIDVNMTMEKISKLPISIEKEIDKKKNFFKRIVVTIINQKKNLKPKTKVKLKWMCLNLLSILEKIIDLKFNSTFHHLVGLIVHQLANSDTLERFLCKLGSSLSSTKIDEFISDRADRVRINKVCDRIWIFVFDNIQKLRGTSRSSLDKLKQSTNIFCNFIRIMSKYPKLKERFSRSKYYKSVDILNLEYKTVFEFSSDLDEFDQFLLEEIKSCLKVLSLEIVLLGDLVKEFGPPLLSVNRKVCSKCGRVYDSRRQKCHHCNLKLSTVSENERIQKKKKEELVEKMKIIAMSKNSSKVRVSDFFSGEINEGEEEEEDGEDLEMTDELTGAREGPKNPELIGVPFPFPGKMLNPSKGTDVEEIVKICHDNSEKNEQNITIFIGDGSPIVIVAGKAIKMGDHPMWDNLLFQNGLWHTKKRYAIIFFFLVRNCIPDALWEMGWDSKKKMDFIAGCSDFHKSWSVVNRFHVSLIKEGIVFVAKRLGRTVEFVENNGQSREVLEEWKKMAKEKENSFFVFLLRFCAKLVRFHRRIRANDKKGVVSSKRMMVKELGLKNSEIYTKINNFEFTDRHILPNFLQNILDDYALLLCKDGITGQDYTLSFSKLRPLSKLNSEKCFQ